MDKLKILKEKFVQLQKLNEDLIENYLAKQNKIKKLEEKNKILKKGIEESADEIQELMKDLDANT
tara:strand:+ start:385 stop:579 length:195 start_codon:yes stop_codon:yes gene_type:complete